MKKILAIGAHPDDIEFGCGGTLLKLSDSGAKIFMYVLTKGDFGGNPEIREKEQIKSASIIGANLIWGGFKDTEVFLNRELIENVEKVIKKVSPDLIFVNYYKDTHQDHIAVSNAVVTAARYINNFLFYETPTSIDFSPTIFNDIGDVFKNKISLLKAHFSQINKTRVKNLSIIESAQSTAIFRGYQGRMKYCESFMAQRIMFDILCSKK
ncbi:MAG: PIG-L family deacetylase [Elusimicrobiota bacterium]